MKMRGDKIPTVRGTGENTPFAEQNKDKERDNGHDNLKAPKTLEDSLTNKPTKFVLNNLKIVVSHGKNLLVTTKLI